MVYGDPVPSLTYNVSTGTDEGIVNNQVVLKGSVQCQDSSQQNVKPNSPVGGTYNVVQGSLSVNENSNYYINSFTSATFSIEKREITVQAISANRVYGESNPQFDFSVSNLYSEDNKSVLFSGSLNSSATETSNIGNYDITIGSLALNSYGNTNYKFANTNAFTGATLTINKKQILVFAKSKSMTYGDNIPNFDYQVDGIISTDILSNVLSGSLSCKESNANNAPNVSQRTNVGSYEIRQGTLNLLSNNYSFSFNPSVLVITKRSISISADNMNEVYGSNNLDSPQLNFTVLGLVNDDVPLNIPANGTTPAKTGVLAGLLSCKDDIDNEVSKTSNVGVYAIKQGDLNLKNNSNYYISKFIQGRLTITRAPLMVSVDDNQTKIVGHPNPSLNYTVNGILNNDSYVLSGDLSTTAVNNSPPGLYPISQGTLKPNSNYFISSFTNGTLSVVNKFVPNLESYSLSFGPKKVGDEDFSIGLPLITNSLQIPNPVWKNKSSHVYVARVNQDNSITITGPGSTTITSTLQGTSEYESVSVSGVLNVSLRTLTGTNVIKKVVGDEDFVIQNLVGYTYSTDNSAVAVGLNNKIHIKGPGSCNIKASKSGYPDVNKVLYVKKNLW